MARIAKKAGYHHGDLQRTLVVAARRIIEKEGPAHLTLRGAAQLAGVSVAAPYRHFADKEALLAAVLAEGFQQLAAEQKAARAAQKKPEAQLVAVGNAYVAFAAANASVYRLMFGPALNKEEHPALLEAGQAALAELVGAVTVCAEAGLFAPSAKVEEVALAGWSLCHGLASLHTDGTLRTSIPVEVHEAGKTLISFLLHGVLKKR